METVFSSLSETRFKTISSPQTISITNNNLTHQKHLNLVDSVVIVVFDTGGIMSEHLKQVVRLRSPVAKVKKPLNIYAFLYVKHIYATI